MHLLNVAPLSARITADIPRNQLLQCSRTNHLHFARHQITMRTQSRRSSSNTKNIRQNHFTIDVLPSRSENLGIITLNRPAALNALSLDMIRSLNHILPQFRSDETMQATLFEGCHTGKRSVFCSGGDVKSVSFLSMNTALKLVPVFLFCH